MAPKKQILLLIFISVHIISATCKNAHSAPSRALAMGTPEHKDENDNPADKKDEEKKDAEKKEEKKKDAEEKEEKKKKEAEKKEEKKKKEAEKKEEKKREEKKKDAEKKEEKKKEAEKKEEKKKDDEKKKGKKEDDEEKEGKKKDDEKKGDEKKENKKDEKKEDKKKDDEKKEGKKKTVAKQDGEEKEDKKKNDGKEDGAANTVATIIRKVEKKIIEFNASLKQRMDNPGSSPGSHECVTECDEVLGAALDDIQKTLESLANQNLVKAKFDVSAVATNVDTCNDCFDEMVGGDPKSKKLSDWVQKTTGDALEALQKGDS